MALPYSFSNNTSPTGGQLDSDLAAIAAMGVISGVVTGTNALVFTPNSNQPAVTVYVNYSLFSFIAAANSTNSVTLQVGSLSPLNVYKPGGSQAGNGDLSSGAPYLAMFLSSLNSGAGGFQIISSLPASAATPVSLGSARDLYIVNNSGTPNTKIDITATAATLVTSGGTPIFIASPSVTIDLTTTGANGMDVGSRPTSGWVYLYLISNGSVTAGLASATSPTSGGPTYPSGYIYSYFAGAMYCDGSQNLKRIKQYGNRAWYSLVASTNTAIPPNIVNGAGGTFSTTSPTLTTASVTGVVPLTASAIVIGVTNGYGGGTLGNVIVAPNTAWGGTNNGPEGSAGNVYPVYLPNANHGNIQATMQLESTNIAYATANSGAGISCLGWIDNWVK